jgi:ribonuclease Y
VETLAAVAAAAGGLVVGLLLREAYVRWLRRSAQKKREEILQEADEDAARIRKEAELAAKAELISRREAFEAETQDVRKELRQQERRLLKREEGLERKVELLERKERFLESTEKKLTNRQKSLKEKTEEVERLIETQKETLHEISGLSREEATRNLLSRLEKEVEKEASDLIDRIVAKAKESADQEATKLLTQSVQRCAADQTAQMVVSTIDIPNDEMKGRIIGREGRNIRAFEKVTGIDVIVDDTPGVVVVSGFNSIRREIARQAMERLIMDGRIHPARIEEVVESVEREVEALLKDEGKKACFELEIHNLHPRLTPMLGRLKFRANLGQNVLQHSMDVARLAGIMAQEMGLDPQIAKRAGLLHDIGLAADYELEGHHALVGADIVRRCDEKREVVNAIAAHHGNVPPESIYAVLVQSANEISNSRPGGRKEAIDQYIKRMERLEEIANGYLGVESAYAIQAGREIRVIVDTAKMDDRISVKVARDLAREIEMKMNYPGEIRVTLVRESRAVEYAR